MASIIDNKKKIMVEELKKSLLRSDRVDILTAFFYFSGYDQLAEELKDKKIRILVGKTIDPNRINELCRNVKENEFEDLDGYIVTGFQRLNRAQKKKNYIDSFVDLFNKSVLSSSFDDTESQKTFLMFLNKIKDGSLEIRFTAEQNHAKAFILTNKEEFSCFGEQKGVVITGSSNFTYNGLKGQGEMNESFTSNEKYDEYMSEFEELWNDSETIDICIKNGNEDFIRKIEERLWLFAKPTPYQIYARILFEMYSSLEECKITNPCEITNGRYANLKYQIDAIKYGIDCIEKNNGVIIADVVGLGKSIVASAIAYNINCRRTVIITPPHLVDQWEEYQQEFGIRGVKVWSSGRLEELYKMYGTCSDPILYIIDEAHRYRNELNESYQWIHQLTRSNAENKVILLTATPYNNRPQDLFALVKLFQTPSRSTINSVDNLGLRFHDLIAKYNQLEKVGKQNLTPEIKNDLERLSEQLRVLIDPVIVRRSRIDLIEIKEYADDLKSQNIKFPEVVGPELIEYDLGSIRDLYVKTLEQLSKNFISARYNPAGYLIDPASFMDKYGDLFEQTNIQLFQRNLADFVKRLLIMRFESSKSAFKVTLENILGSYENIKKWWAKGYVPIKKHGYLGEPDEEEIEELIEDIDKIGENVVDLNKIKEKAIPLPRDLFDDRYIDAIESDIKLLQNIREEWFSASEIGIDPKFSEVERQLSKMLKDNPNRKIVIFSSYADTATYVKEKLEKDGFRVLLFTGGGTKKDRQIVRENFDASLRIDNQKNDYDIIVATDALSEGFNLNRAGAIFNYDIPYNPTRVVQRIGRINRINKKMFDKIFIYNLFPTDIGEQNILIKSISTLKMLLINNIVGSDTKTLTPDESLQSYFKKQYDEASKESHEKSWDNEYKNEFDLIKHNITLKNEVMEIPERARLVRKNQDYACAISFAKRGANTLFAIAYNDSTQAEIVPPEKVLKLFRAKPEEVGYKFDPELDKKFAIIRDEIKQRHPKIKNTKLKSNALDNLEQLKVVCPEERDYISDLIDIIKTYDDLSDGELKFLKGLKIIPSESHKIIEKVKNNIPEHYIISIKEKAEAIDSQTEIILFTEDLRRDNT